MRVRFPSGAQKHFSVFAIKVAPYSFMTARELVANLAGNLLIIGKTYDVTCVKMPKHEHKYLAFPSVNFFRKCIQYSYALYINPWELP